VVAAVRPIDDALAFDFARELYAGDEAELPAEAQRAQAALAARHQAGGEVVRVIVR
jgi:hypothetical protein